MRYPISSFPPSFCILHSFPVLPPPWPSTYLLPHYFFRHHLSSIFFYLSPSLFSFFFILLFPLLSPSFFFLLPPFLFLHLFLILIRTFFFYHVPNLHTAVRDAIRNGDKPDILLSSLLNKRPPSWRFLLVSRYLWNNALWWFELLSFWVQQNLLL